MRFKIEWPLIPPGIPQLKGEQELPPLKGLMEKVEEKTGGPQLSRFDPLASPHENLKRIFRK